MVPPSSEQVPSKHKNTKNTTEAQKSSAYYDENNAKVNNTLE